MIRLYTPHPLVESERVPLTEKQIHYLMRVMRLSEGSSVLAFNGADGEWACVLESTSKKAAFLNPRQQTRTQQTEESCFLYMALIKKENMDLVIQKATELGVTKIIPLLTERTVVRGFNQERATLIAIEAAEQSERLCVPSIETPVALSQITRHIPPKTTLFYLAERAKANTPLTTPVQFPAFLIGPEGGFTPAENQFLTQLPFVQTIHLGHTILRAETAALAALACWQFKGTF